MTIQQAFEVALQHHQSGRLAEAEGIYRQILAVEPRHADALHFLGVIAHQVGQNDAAVDLIRQAIELAPSAPDFHCNLGEAYRALGLQDDAIAACRQAIALRPNFPEAHSNLGNALRGCGKLDEAIAACRQAIALRPSYPEAHSNLGAALQGKGQLDEAIVACREAIALKPNYPDAHSNLGNAMRDKEQLNEAIAAYRRAIAIKPDFADAHNNLGNALKDSGQLDEAISAYRCAMALKPGYAEAHSNLVLTLNYHPGCDGRAVAEEAGRWEARHARPLRKFIPAHGNERTPGRRLRIGYVSPDFREHSVARFLLPLLANHDREGFEIFAYAQVASPDEVTGRFRSYADVWRSLVGLTDEQTVELIVRDGIDILVDLAGHTANNRLPVFARKPAPVQVSWLGYPGTTGLGTMDYRLSDAFADPAGAAEFHGPEELIRLAPSAWCFEAAASPAVPARGGGPVTFGCFNALAKINGPLLKLWGRILGELPESRLLLKAAGLASAEVRQRMEQALGEAGIGPGRVELHGRVADYGGHLALYGRVDIALDTYPYHGTTTTCEAMWMGVPVVSLAGRDHVSRVGVSLLGNVGLPELVAYSEEEYVRIATGLGGDLPRLGQLRRTLRQRMEASPLMDAPRFARDIEAAYREMWRRWCAGSFSLPSS